MLKPVAVMCGFSVVLMLSLFFLPHSYDEGVIVWMRYLGEFHPMVIHLTIGAMLVSLSMELGSLMSRGRWRPQILWVLFIAAVSSAPACLLGFCSHVAKGGESELLGEHMRDAILFSSLLMIVFLCKYIAELKKNLVFKKISSVLLWLCGLLMVAAAHHGGEYTHGELSDKAPWKEKPQVIVASKEALVWQPETPFFAGVIQPIFEKKCIECHGEKEDKGDVTMHTWEGIAEIINETEPERSLLLESIHLPIDDEMHMPPHDEVQLTLKEIELIRWWAKHGFDRFKTIEELNFPLGFFSKEEE